MPKLTARKLLDTLDSRVVLKEAKKPAAPPLNLDKWRGELRDIRNQLIKLRDKAEAELDRVEEAGYNGDLLTAKENAALNTLQDQMEHCVDNIANAINEIDISL